MAAGKNTSNPTLYRITLAAIITSLALGAASTARADDSAWEYYSEGDGTAFEERWAVVELIERASSADADMGLGVRTVRYDYLSMYVRVVHSHCTYTDWEVAIDQTRYVVRTVLSTDESAMFFELGSEDYESFWGDFLTGDRIAVRFNSECEDVLGKLLGFDETETKTLGTTLVFSLSGSRSAIEHVLGSEP